MILKSKKVLQKIAPFLEEGILRISSKMEVEILSLVACDFLQVDKNVRRCLFSLLKNTPLTEKIKQMIKQGEGHCLLEDEDRSFSIRLIPFPKWNDFICVIKDASDHEKMLHMGKEFVGNASHELRTPITIIKGFTEMLLDSDEIDSFMQKSILEKMSASCLRMEHLVNHLLRLTDLENSDLEGVIAVDIHSLIEDVSYQVLSIYPEFRIEHLRTDEDIYALVDAGLIELVMTNLFKNAVKYSREEKVIIVQVEIVADEIYIQIKDKGIGVSKKNLEKIFNRFYTVDKAHCRKLGGAGLGLSIVKLIVEKHGGKIYATSQLGVSSTIHLHLPLEKKTNPEILGSLSQS